MVEKKDGCILMFEMRGIQFNYVLQWAKMNGVMGDHYNCCEIAVPYAWNKSKRN